MSNLPCESSPHFYFELWGKTEMTLVKWCPSHHCCFFFCYCFFLDWWHLFIQELTEGRYAVLACAHRVCLQCIQELQRRQRKYHWPSLVLCRTIDPWFLSWNDLAVPFQNVVCFDRWIKCPYRCVEKTPFVNIQYVDAASSEDKCEDESHKSMPRGEQ